jgi:hypothetical protein
MVGLHETPMHQVGFRHMHAEMHVKEDAGWPFRLERRSKKRSRLMCILLLALPLNKPLAAIGLLTSHMRIISACAQPFFS